MSTTLQNFINYKSHILSLEKTRIKLDKEALLSIALVFPNSYEVAMSNLGFQTLYRLFNESPGVRCERAFMFKSFPDVIHTIETGQSLNRFDIIAFSIPFELDYLNVLHIIRACGIEIYAKDRHPRDPLIIAGGVTSFLNPAPLTPFIDLFYIGEVEPSMNIFIDQLILMKEQRENKEDFLARVAEQNGFYSPRHYNENTKIQHIIADPERVDPQYSSVITPKSHFQDTFLIEVGRGCGRFCKFCAACHIYHPARFFDKEKLSRTISKHIFETKKVGLVGAALCDYPGITELCESLVKNKYQLGLSSFRFEVISDRFLDIIHQAGIRTITLAPEAGSERLRSLINKRLTDEHILHAMKLIAGSKIINIKLYFLIGLPFENQNDVDCIVQLVKKIYNIVRSRSKSRKEISISINAFIPKPFTPFQWSKMETEAVLKKKRRYISTALKGYSGLTISKKSTRAEIMQGMLSTGDHLVLDKLFHSRNPDSYTKLKLSEPMLFQESDQHIMFPWDFLEYPVSKNRLWRQWKKSYHDSQDRK